MILDRMRAASTWGDMKEYVEQASLHLEREALQMTPKEITTNIGPGINHVSKLAALQLK